MVESAPAGNPHLGRIAKTVVIVVLVVIAFVSLTGLGWFGTSLWIAYGVMATIEIAMAILLIASRWRSRPAAIVVAILAVFQAGQTFYNEQVRYERNDPVIPIDNLGVLLLCLLATALIATGAAWPVMKRAEA